MKGFFRIVVILVLVGLISACNGPSVTADNIQEGKLAVVVTTTFVGDVVENIAGENVHITTLLEPGQNPHSYQPSPMDMVAFTEADLVFVNGFGLEDFLDDLMSGSDTNAEVVVVSNGVKPLMTDKHMDDHQDEEVEGDDMEAVMGQDPHVWFNPKNVLIWSENIAQTLIGLDPDHASDYQNNLEAYQELLISLDAWIIEQVDRIPSSRRELVTDHQTLGYFVREYEMVQVGAVIPALTTEAETSGMELAELIDAIREHQTGAVFVGVDIDPTLAERVADETGIKLVPLYFGSLSDGEPAGTYLTFMRYNVSAIVQALQ